MSLTLTIWLNAGVGIEPNPMEKLLVGVYDIDELQSIDRGFGCHVKI